MGSEKEEGEEEELKKRKEEEEGGGQRMRSDRLDTCADAMPRRVPPKNGTNHLAISGVASCPAPCP